MNSSIGSTLGIDCIKCVHAYDVNVEEEISLLPNILPSFVPNFGIEVANVCLHEESLDTNC